MTLNVKRVYELTCDAERCDEYVVSLQGSLEVHAFAQDMGWSRVSEMYGTQHYCPWHVDIGQLPP